MMTSRSTAHCHLSPYNNGILAAGIASPVAEVVLFFLKWNIEIWVCTCCADDDVEGSMAEWF